MIQYVNNKKHPEAIHLTNGLFYLRIQKELKIRRLQTFYLLHRCRQSGDSYF
jgi:hypothetical protein